MSFPRSLAPVLGLSVVLILSVALSARDSGGDNTPAPTVEDVNAYLDALPTWSEFSLTRPDAGVPVGIQAAN